jgi:hypothetical protein
MAKEKEKKREPKPLTALSVIQRVRGCGEADAASLLAALSLDEGLLLEAYKDGAGVVEAVICEAHDAKYPPTVESSEPTAE